MSPGDGKKSLKKKAKIFAVCLIFASCCVLGRDGSFAFWNKNLTYEGESVYNYLQVYDDGDKVALSTNVLFGVQSVYKKEKGLTGMYYDYAMAAPYMAGVNEKDVVDVLILGMGTGTYCTQCMRYFDNVRVDGVEIDEKITKLAKKYFEMPSDVDVAAYDGRAYLNSIEKKYDVIMVDAYQDITIPFQMSSVEFFNLVKDHLKDGGVMTVNMNMRGRGEDDINAYLSDTIADVFDEVYTVDVDYSTNRELFASDSPDITSEFLKNLEAETDVDLKAMMSGVEKKLAKYDSGGRVMTDDKAPVELLGIKVIDEIIKDEAAYYKGIFKERGIDGLLDEFM